MRGPRKRTEATFCFFAFFYGVLKPGLSGRVEGRGEGEGEEGVEEEGCVFSCGEQKFFSWKVSVVGCLVLEEQERGDSRFFGFFCT
jgi:hypothetical protein